MFRLSRHSAPWLVVLSSAVVVSFVGRNYVTRLQAANAELESRVPIAGAGGTLMLGGGGLPEGLYEHFVSRAGGKTARIVVIPCYDADAGELQELRRDWLARGVAAVDVLHARSRGECAEPAFAAPLARATGVWLTGGEQSRIARLYAETPVEAAVKAVLARGGVVGGTSAGASAMSRVMIEQGREEAVVSRGFDLLPEIVVDQHFFRRNRLRRLLGILDERPGLIGLGIDEGTAVIIERDGRLWSVIGESYALACLPHAGRSPQLEVLQPGGWIGIDALKRALRSDSVSMP